MRMHWPLLAVLVFAACSGAGGEETATTSPATAPRPSTTTVPPSTTTIPPTATNPVIVEQAKQDYLSIVDEYNPALADVNDRYFSHDFFAADLVESAEAPAWCAELAPITERFATRLRAVDWPSDVQDEVDELAGAAAAATGLLYACADLPGTAEAQGAMFDEIKAAFSRSSQAASNVRSVLGLPIDR